MLPSEGKNQPTKESRSKLSRRKRAKGAELWSGGSLMTRRMRKNGTTSKTKIWMTFTWTKRILQKKPNSQLLEEGRGGGWMGKATRTPRQGDWKRIGSQQKSLGSEKSSTCRDSKKEFPFSRKKRPSFSGKSICSKIGRDSTLFRMSILPSNS